MKTTQKVNTFEYDIDSVITFDFSFDILKKILLSLNTKNDELNSKLTEITKKYDDLKKSNDSNTKQNKELIEKFDRKLRALEKNFKSIKEQKKDFHIEKEVIKDEDKDLDNENEIDIDTIGHNKEDIQSKNKVSDSMSRSSSFSDLLGNEAVYNVKKFNDLSTRIDEVESRLKAYTPLTEISKLNTKQNEFINQMKDVEMQLNNVKLKVDEFDIKDLLLGAKTENGNIDTAKLLYLSLEKQIKGKFDVIDSLQTQTNKDIASLQSLLDSSKLIHQKELLGLDDQIRNLSKNIKDVDTKLTTIPHKFDITNTGMGGSHDEDKNENRDSILLNATNIDKVTAENQELKKTIFVLKNKIKDIDKDIKKLTTNVDLEKVVNDINTIQDTLGKKASKEDLTREKNNIVYVENVITTLKDSNERNSDDIKKCNSAIASTLKKMEAVYSSVVSVKNSYDQMHKASKLNFDPTKYMELSIFNDFIRVFNREVDRLKKDYEDILKQIETIFNDMKLKANDSDMKSLEDYLTTKIEDLKILCHRKFSDKIDTQKGFKYLEMQFKQYMDVSVKNSYDKGESWLIAKKPVGGFSCASCESYLGELQDKKEYIPWNKYPSRVDPTLEQTMRIGNGFSRMLNMLNIDNHTNKNVATKPEHEDNKIYESEGEITSKSIENKKKALPKLNNYRSTGELGIYSSEDNTKINNESNLNVYSTSKDENSINRFQESDQPRL